MRSECGQLALACCWNLRSTASSLSRASSNCNPASRSGLDRGQNCSVCLMANLIRSIATRAWYAISNSIAVGRDSAFPSINRRTSCIICEVIDSTHLHEERLLYARSRQRGAQDSEPERARLSSCSRHSKVGAISPTRVNPLPGVGPRRSHRNSAGGPQTSFSRARTWSADWHFRLVCRRC